MNEKNFSEIVQNSFSERLLAAKNTNKEISYLEESLKVRLPNSYRQFLSEKPSLTIDGFKFFGLPSNEVSASIFESTLVLRNRRDKLPRSIVVISITDTKALCLDLAQDHREDAPLVEIDLVQNDAPPKPLGKTFKEWFEQHEQYEKRFREAYQRVKERRAETEEKKNRTFSHIKDGLIPKPKDWRPIISRVQDYIVGLTTLRYNPLYNCLEVDEFYTLDHPDYEPGEAIRNLIKLIFVTARDFSGSLDIIFTQKWPDKKRFRIPPRPIPKELIDLAAGYGITFKESKQGKISHEEGVELFFSFLDFPQEVRAKVAKLEKAGYLTKEMIGEIIHTGIWSREEAIWLFLNAPRAEAVLLGSAIADNRPYNAEALAYARSVLLATRLKQVIMAQMRDGCSSEEKEGIEITLEPKEKFWILKGDEKFYLPPSWTIDKSEIRVETNEPVLLLSRPRLVARPEYNKSWIKKDIELLLGVETAAKKRCLLLNHEFISPDYNSSVDEIKEIVKEAVSKRVYVLFPPARTAILLDEEIEKRMRKTRAMKAFPLREGPLKLWVFEISASAWDIPSEEKNITRDVAALRNASKDAKVFAKYILNKIDIHRYRKQFAFNCEVVERIALSYSNSKKVIELDGKESEELITALKSKDKVSSITFSYVRADETPSFMDKIHGKIKKSLSNPPGGIVLVVAPYEPLEAPPIIKTEDEKRQESSLLVKLPDIVARKIDVKIKEGAEKRKYASSEIAIKSASRHIQTAIDKQLPLAISSVQPQVFVETMREYLNYSVFVEEKKERFLWFFSRRKKYKRREPPESIEIRIGYGDGTEGKPFPLFCLADDFQKPKNLFELHASLVSLRHMKIDYFTDISLIRNMEIQDRENSAEQEEFAFRKVHFFLENLIKLLRQEVDVGKISQEEKIFLYLWKKYNLAKKKTEALKLYLHQGTGLEPAVVGSYRAVVEILKQYRGQLIVVPQISVRNKETLEFNYTPAKEWC